MSITYTKSEKLRYNNTYLNTTYPQLTSDPCHRCGNNLILVDVVTEKVPGQYGEVTTASYKCSDESCQRKAEQELARIVKRREEQEAAKELRLQRQRQRNHKNVV